MTARAQIPFANFNSAEAAASSADTATASFEQPPAPGAVVGNDFAQSFQNCHSAETRSSADTVTASLQPPAPDAVAGYLTSRSMGDAKTRHGHLAAVVDQEATAAFSFPESVRQLACRRVTAGDTGDMHPLASSPADFSIPAIPFAKLPSRNRFDQYFDPDGFLAAIEQKSQPQLLQTLFQLAGDI